MEHHEKYRFVAEVLFAGLTNKNTGFDSSTIPHVSPEDFQIVLDRCAETGAGVCGIEIFDVRRWEKDHQVDFPLLYAPNHQHFFNVRLDVAIDGIGNTVQQLDVVADPLGESNPFGNAFHLAAKDLATEREAQAHLNLETGRTWKFTNSSVRNFLGDPVGYKFSPGDNAFPFASPDAWWRRRASYVDHHVWVTPYREDEQYAAGYYPNQSTGGDGLPALTAANRSILNTGVVF